MLKKIIGTTGTRILNAAFNLIILVIITNKIGSTGFGIIGLILVDISIIQLSVDLVAGSSLVYFASRANLGQLLFPALVFVAVVIVLYYLLGLLGLTYFPILFNTIVPEGYFFHILALSAIGSLMWITYNLLLGQSRIRVYNIIFVLQVSTFLVVFSSIIYIVGMQDVTAYLIALYVSYSVAAIAGYISIFSKSGKIKVKGWLAVTKKVFSYGLVSQMANLLSIGNNRMSFFFIKYFSGLPAVGIYNAGLQTTEGFKLIGQSIAVVQFSTISNVRDSEYSRILTIRLMKISVLLTLAAVIVINILPESFYTWLFSDDFIGVKPVIMALSPGVLALAANNIFSHYFSGIGQPKVNLIAKVIGFVFTVILAILLIPKFGFIGAAITASVSYIATVVYQYRIFWTSTKTKHHEWIPSKSDVTDFKRIMKEAIEKENNN